MDGDGLPTLDDDSPRGEWKLWASGGVLVVIAGALTFLSSYFGEADGPAWATWSLVGLLVAAGVAYLLAVRWRSMAGWSRRRLAAVVGVGLAMRVVMFASNPMWEVDYHRYLWDGAVLANGMDPYAYSPDDGSGARDSKRPVPPELKALAQQPGASVGQIHYGELRTIYPPVAQLAFALAYALGPWSLTALRLVFLVFDAAALCLLLMLLRRRPGALGLVLIYWWNPLLVKEVYNSAHMDVLALPIVLGAILLSVRRRYIASSLVLALAVGVKIWPVILLPLLLRQALAKRSTAMLSLFAFASACAALFAPVLWSGLGGDSGFTAYGGGWEMNDSLFMILNGAVSSLFWMLGADAGGGALVALTARVLAAAGLVAWVVHLSLRPSRDAGDLMEKCLLAVAAAFLLSPTQFPWYFIWMLPMLASMPRTSLLALTVTLPVYYLRFYFRDAATMAELIEGWSGAEVFDYFVVWVEFVPVLLLLALEWRKGREASRLASVETPAR